MDSLVLQTKDVSFYSPTREETVGATSNKTVRRSFLLKNQQSTTNLTINYI
jgi:hypothetical protein